MTIRRRSKDDYHSHVIHLHWGHTHAAYHTASLKPHSVLRRAPRGFTLRAIRVYLGYSDFHTVHHTSIQNPVVVTIACTYRHLMSHGAGRRQPWGDKGKDGDRSSDQAERRRKVVWTANGLAQKFSRYNFFYFGCALRRHDGRGRFDGLMAITRHGAHQPIGSKFLPFYFDSLIDGFSTENGSANEVLCRRSTFWWRRQATPRGTSIRGVSEHIMLGQFPRMGSGAFKQNYFATPNEGFYCRH